VKERQREPEKISVGGREAGSKAVRIEDIELLQRRS
jgi:hypothetical protein